MNARTKALLSQFAQRRATVTEFQRYSNPFSDLPRTYYTLIANNADRTCSAWEWALTLVSYT